MTLTEICLVTITVTILAGAGALVAIVLHLRTSVRLLEGLIQESARTARRLDEVGGEVQGFLHQANKDYRAVSAVAGRVISAVAVPAGSALALVQGVRAAVGIFLHRGGRKTQPQLANRSAS